MDPCALTKIEEVTREREMTGGFSVRVISSQGTKMEGCILRHPRSERVNNIRKKERSWGHFFEERYIYEFFLRESEKNHRDFMYVDRGSEDNPETD